MAEAKAKKEENTIDITSKSKTEVLHVLEGVVNDRVKYQEKTSFYFDINFNNSMTYLLQARPQPDHPGNALLKLLRPQKYGPRMVIELNAIYKGNAADFAQDIRALFDSNDKINNFPYVTAELYMLLLFEIARREVVDDNKSDTAKKYDDLPIEEAIGKILFLMEKGECTFEDVFLQGKEGYKVFCKKPEDIDDYEFKDGGRFHCFSHPSPEYRQNRIDAIFKKHEEITKSNILKSKENEENIKQQVEDEGGKVEEEDDERVDEITKGISQTHL